MGILVKDRFTYGHWFLNFEPNNYQQKIEIFKGNFNEKIHWSQKIRLLSTIILKACVRKSEMSLVLYFFSYLFTVYRWVFLKRELICTVQPVQIRRCFDLMRAWFFITTVNHVCQWLVSIPSVFHRCCL